MSYSLYKLLHILGIFLVFGSVAGLALHGANGGSKDSNRLRKGVGIAHGIGLVLVLVAGFGLLAKIGVEGGSMFPGWAIAKLVIWMFFAAAVAIPFRRREWAGPLFFALPFLAMLAAYLAVYKPF